MIRSFADRETERLFRRERSRIPSDIQRRALRKLLLLHAATDINQLRVPPGNRLEALTGNRLEALTGDRERQHSIRINRQWRICFRWHEGDAHDVKITDYH